MSVNLMEFLGEAFADDWTDIGLALLIVYP
jgi:hypothetical protein